MDGTIQTGPPTLTAYSALDSAFEFCTRELLGYELGRCLITRHGKDEIGWRSIDRKLGEQDQPDSLPVKLKRDPVAK